MRRNSLRILILAVMFAVTALSAVGFFADRVGRVLSVEGAAAIAADLVIEQGDPIPSAWLEEARRLKLQTSRMVRFPSVLFFGDRPQLVQIKAVDTNYPLRGALRVRLPSGKSKRPAPPGDAIVGPRLARAIGHAAGNVNLGRLQLRIVGQLLEEPDLAASLFQLASRLLVNWDDAERSGLLGPASRARYRLLIAGSGAAVRQFRSWLQPRLLPGSELLTPENGRPELVAAIERARRFLSLAALCGSLLAGVAILLAVRDYLERSLDEAGRLAQRLRDWKVPDSGLFATTRARLVAING